MEKEFVPYNLAKQIKQLGFKQECFGYYIDVEVANPFLVKNIVSDDQGGYFTLAPTFSQAFRWFREKYNLHHSISILQRSCRYHFKIRTIECESDLKPFGDNKIISEDGPRKKYEDIELDCLKKLIEIVKDGKK